jgi:hypothetical protein
MNVRASFLVDGEGLSLKHVGEKHFYFDPEVLHLPDGVRLDGYWQSEKYFSDIEKIIRREFIVRASPSQKNREMAQRIASCESVSLHIRRGDYLSEPHTASVHGICPLDYYQRCVNAMSGEVKKPHFFVFSDEPRWVERNFSLPFPMVVVEHNGPQNPHEDLRLMSLCQHQVIANSSFSWWGAWLCGNDHKIVMAPRRWFNRDGYDTRDLIPDGWRLM